MGKAWVKARRRETYYRRAKQMAYRSRAAFKLLQIHRRFGLIRRGDVVVDLGASPGGWSQVAAELAGPEGRVIAVDIVPMGPLEGVDILRGDFTESGFVAVLLETLGRPADLVVCDAAPKLSGVRSIDQARGVALARAALDIASRALRVRGGFVAKVFRGSDYVPFLRDVSMAFDAVKEYTPRASPKGSAEVYVVALGKR